MHQIHIAHFWLEFDRLFREPYREGHVVGTCHPARRNDITDVIRAASSAHQEAGTITSMFFPNP
jgi:hypothetical protein